MSTSLAALKSPPSGDKLQSEPMNKPVLVGLYGLPGAGKTFMLKQLQEKLGDDFKFYEGSQTIGNIVPGGLEAFERLSDMEKVDWREKAIEFIRDDCVRHGRAGVVTGHFMFWSENAPEGSLVYTAKDMTTYTHIIYLDVPAKVLTKRCINDKKRDRLVASPEHLHNWQNAEKVQLRSLCREYGILFSILLYCPALLQRATTMLRDFRQHSESFNIRVAERYLDEAVSAAGEVLQTMLVLDADRTLAAQDTGGLFWQETAKLGIQSVEEDPLKVLFSGSLQYSYNAFRQATLMYEETDDATFDKLCEAVATEVKMYPEFISLLRKVAVSDHVGAVVITCGLRGVWKRVFAKYGLEGGVHIIGGGRIADGVVVNADIKKILVQRLQSVHSLYVWAFGDSPLDLKMLAEANEAIVVVGEEEDRSTTMDSSLRDAISDGFQARQALIPKAISPRLSTAEIPLVDLNDGRFLSSVFCLRQRQRPRLSFVHSTAKNAAKLLMTPMRDAAVSGPALREAHRRVGQYLAIEYLADTIGIEEYAIRHVQGSHTCGFRVCQESMCLVVALMRGGEPMALGINDALPLAAFLHANLPGDIKAHHLQGQQTLVLVDSVINTGKTVLDFVKHVRSLHKTIRVVVVAGVVQADFLSTGGLRLTTDVDLVALRLSENKFKGRGFTDTGNRLFNTTQLP